MKRYFLFLLAVLTVFSNCSKDDDNGPEPIVIDKSPNLRGTGDSANEILSNDNYNMLLVEAAYVRGFRPTEEAMVEFTNYLRERTFKEEIEVIYRELPSSGEESFTLQEIADLELENRTAFNNGTTLAIYLYFADAPSVDDKEDEGLVTLGAVYRNTSMVIYEQTIRRLAVSSVQISNADVESATLNHEFGHLFGLVDLGSPPVNDHEDTESANHCNVEGCLMRAELQFGSGIMGMLEKRASKGLAVAPGLDAECILDLRANGGR